MFELNNNMTYKNKQLKLIYIHFKSIIASTFDYLLSISNYKHAFTILYSKEGGGEKDGSKGRRK